MIQIIQSKDCICDRRAFAILSNLNFENDIQLNSNYHKGTVELCEINSLNFTPILPRSCGYSCTVWVQASFMFPRQELSLTAMFSTKTRLNEESLLVPNYIFIIITTVF